MNKARRLHQAAASVASGLTLLALTVGVPILLVGLHGRPDQPCAYQGLVELFDGRVRPVGIVDLVAAVGWGAWLVVTVAVIVEVSAWTRGRPTPRLAIGAPIQPWVRHLVATTALLAGTLTPTVRAAATPLPAPATVTVRATPAEIIPAAESVGPALPAVPVTADPPGRPPTCTVVPRDTLWGLAATHLRDPLRWREIYALNRNVAQADGRHLDDPNLILPGWVLQLPADANPTPAAAAAAAPVASEAPPASSPAPESVTPRTSERDPIPTTTPTDPSTVPRPITNPAPSAATDANTRHVTSPANETEALEVSATVAGGLIALLTVVRLARRRHRTPPVPLPPAAHRIEGRLRSAAAATPVQVDAALRILAPALQREAARVLLVRVREDACVEVLLDKPLASTPAGFAATDDPRDWVTTAAPHALAAVEPSDLPDRSQPLSQVTSIGKIEGESVLLDLQTVRLLTVDGEPPAVSDWLRHITVELATSTIGDPVQVLLVGGARDDDFLDGHPRLERLAIGEALDKLETLHDEEREVGSGYTTVLISLTEPDDQSRARVETVTADPDSRIAALVASATPAAWHAQLNEARLRLAPLGLVLEPFAIPGDTAAAIRELLEPPETVGDPAIEVAAAPLVSAREMTEPAWELEFRVLGPVEVIGGARPFDRHKHLEIAVYLALHPDGVSDERLKTVLWPERAPSTPAFNTAISTTRNRLGHDSDGDVFLSHYMSAGRRYRLNAHAGSDYARFEAHVARARGDDGDTIVRQLRTALELVRGQPFAEVSGFGWAWAEGHVANMEATIAEAAHRLAAAYLDRNEPEQAIWAAMRGLLAAPADEILYRDRMLAYDVAGNPAGVETVMHELEVVVEGIEPWDSIHPDTIALYRRLTRSRTASTRRRARVAERPT